MARVNWLMASNQDNKKMRPPPLIPKIFTSQHYRKAKSYFSSISVSWYISDFIYFSFISSFEWHFLGFFFYSMGMFSEDLLDLWQYQNIERKTMAKLYIHKEYCICVSTATYSRCRSVEVPKEKEMLSADSRTY